jgi:hypothetical protein
MANKALKELIQVGEDCKRSGWPDNKVLWCTSQHKITVGMLLNLKKCKQQKVTECKYWNPQNYDCNYKGGPIYCGKYSYDIPDYCPRIKEPTNEQ